MMRAHWFALVLAVAIVTIVWLLLPPAAERLTLPPDPLTARGAIHVHTVRSDGTGTPDEVAAAAHRTGLDFVVLTDHGDATRAPDPPRYVDGALLIDAVEISTDDGHLIALGIPQSPYRLAGEARDVLEDVHRLGGFGIAAHPDSPKGELQWRDWKAPIDGLEWLNVDSEWRDESRLALSRALLTYWIRPAEALVSLLDRPTRTLERWDHLSVTRPVVAIAGHDTHARIPLSAQSEVGEGRSLGIPSYASAFGALSQGVILETPLGRTAMSASSDAAAILKGIRAGATYTVIDGLAGPAALDFHAFVDERKVRMGESVTGGNSIQLNAVVRASSLDTLVLLRNGEEVKRANDGMLLDFSGPLTANLGSYRVEVRRSDAPGIPPVPWIVSNPIFVGLPAPSDVPPRTADTGLAQFDGSLGAWDIERAPTSQGRVEIAERNGPPALQFNWRLGEGTPSGQYAALVVPIHGDALRAFDQIAVTAAARRPTRVSVQIRIPQGTGLRWRRSIYVDQTPRTAIVAIGDMRPIEAPPGTALDLSKADTLLFVVDTVNAVPGMAGEISLTDVRWRSTRGADAPPPH